MRLRQPRPFAGELVTCRRHPNAGALELYGFRSQWRYPIRDLGGAVDAVVYDANAGLLLYVSPHETMEAIDLGRREARGAVRPQVVLRQSSRSSQLWLEYPGGASLFSSRDEGWNYLHLFASSPPTLHWSPSGDQESVAMVDADLGHLASILSRGSAAPRFPSVLTFDAATPELARHEDACGDVRCGSSLPLGTHGAYIVAVDRFADSRVPGVLVYDATGDPERAWLTFPAFVSGDTDARRPSGVTHHEVGSLGYSRRPPVFEAAGQAFSPKRRSDRLCEGPGECVTLPGQFVDFLSGGVEVGVGPNDRPRG